MFPTFPLAQMPRRVVPLTMTPPQPTRTGQRSASDGVLFQASKQKADQPRWNAPKRVTSIITHSRPVAWLKRTFSVKNSHQPPKRAPIQLPQNFSQTSIVPLIPPRNPNRLVPKSNSTMSLDSSYSWRTKNQTRPNHGWNTPPLPLSPQRSQSRSVKAKPVKLPEISFPSPSSSDISDWSYWTGPPSESSLLESAREELIYLEAQETAMTYEVQTFFETGNMQGIKWLLGL